MRRNTLTFRVLAIALCLSAVFMPVAMAATPAGTQITASGTAQYYSTSGALMPTATSNSVTTTVGQLAGVSISPVSASKPGTAGTAVDFAATVTNTGNGSDSYGLSSSSSTGSSVTVYKDDNGDGVRQSTEVTTVTATTTLGAGGTFKCIVSAKLPSTATTDTITLLATSKYDATKTAKATFSIQSDSAAKTYVKSWLVNGYYGNTNTSTRLSTDYLSGEAGVAPTQGSTSGGKTWTAHSSSTSVVDLVGVYGAQTYCVAYAHAYVYSPSAQTVNLWLGSDNGIKVWVNGANVWTNDSTRGYTADQDKRTINLTAGWNRLLVKISQYGGNWAFSARICDSSGNAIQGVTFALQPPTADNSAPVISNAQTTYVGSNSCTIEWDTNEPSITLLDYGTTSSLGTRYSNTTMVTHHKATIGSLVPNTTYSVKVGSADSAGNTAWNGPYNFTTANAPVASGAYVQSWLLNGYYTNTDKLTRLSKDYLGGEASVAPVDNSTASNGFPWGRYDSSTSLIDLAAVMGKPSSCAGYAFTYVYSPAAQTANLWMGSDDGIKVWLNGAVVWTNDTYRGCVDGQDKAPISLKAGWNRLLVKISQGSYGWRFILKVCDGSGNAIPGIAHSPSP